MTGRSPVSTYRAMKWFSRAPSSSLDGLFSWELVKSYDTQQCEAITRGRPIGVGMRTRGVAFILLKQQRLSSDV
jgi:hypothetical protein